MVISIIFIAMRLYEMWEYIDIGYLVSFSVLMLLLLVALGECITVFLCAINFRDITSDISGININRILAVKIYNTSNIYKYIPGGVMLVVGRNQLAIEVDGLNHGQVFLATIVEGVLMAIAAVALSMIFAHSYLRRLLSQLQVHFMFFVAIVLVISVVVLLIYRYRHKLLQYLFNTENREGNFRVVALFKRLPLVTVCVALWGFSFVATMAILGQPMTAGLVVTIAGLYIISWVAGFLTPGAPSGIGIREVVLLMFLSGVVYEEILLTAIVLHRVLQVIGDVIAFSISWIYDFRKRKQLIADKG